MVNQIFRGQKSFAHVVAVVFSLMVLMLIRGYSIPIIFCASSSTAPFASPGRNGCIGRRRKSRCFSKDVRIYIAV